MFPVSTIQTLTQLSYLIAAALFILGLKRMSSPLTAVSGVRWAGAGMVLATLVTLVFTGTSTLNLALIIGAIAVGSIVAWVSGKRVAMTKGSRAAIAALAVASGRSYFLGL